MIDFLKVQMLMIKHRHTNKYIAKYLGLSDQGWRNKKTGQTPMNANEIKKIADLYKVKVDELYEKEVV